MSTPNQSGRLKALQKRRALAHKADDWVTFWAVDAAIMVLLNLHDEAHRALNRMDTLLEKERNYD